MTVIVGDCRDILPTFDAESFDACVCDPPYDLTNRVPDVLKCRDCGRVCGGRDGTPVTCPRCGGELYRQRTQGGGFMGKDWDGTGVAFDPETWRAVFRVLKPGGRLLAFGGTRTHHRMVCAIEDAGFVIEDEICWLTGQGFPKHKSKLKPGHEPICVAWKPDTRATMLQIDACRIGTGESLRRISCGRKENAMQESGGMFTPGRDPVATGSDSGRWPANVVLSHIPPDEHGNGGCKEVGTRRVNSNGHYPKARPAGGIGNDGHAGQDGLDERHTRGEVQAVWDCSPDCPILLLDAQSGERKVPGPYEQRTKATGSVYGGGNGLNASGWIEGKVTPHYGDSGGASRFYATFPPDDEATRFLYCPKSSRRERNAGLAGMPERVADTLEGDTRPGRVDRERRNNHTPAAPRANHHPTVKPIALMSWLVRLVTPPGGTILDPFAGSGSTGCAAALEGLDFVGIEMDEEYAEIARRRIAHAERYGERWLEVAKAQRKGDGAVVKLSEADKTRECNVCGCRAAASGAGGRWPNCEHDEWSWVPKLNRSARDAAQHTVTPPATPTLDDLPLFAQVAD